MVRRLIIDTVRLDRISITPVEKSDRDILSEMRADVTFRRRDTSTSSNVTRRGLLIGASRERARSEDRSERFRAPIKKKLSNDVRLIQIDRQLSRDTAHGAAAK